MAPPFFMLQFPFFLIMISKPLLFLLPTAQKERGLQVVQFVQFCLEPEACPLTPLLSYNLWDPGPHLPPLVEVGAPRLLP